MLTAPRKMEIQEFQLPQIGPGDALLKIELAGVCGSDPKSYYGKSRADYLPMILGHEILGRIEEIGSEARERLGVKKGDRVVVSSQIPCGRCPYCMSGNPRWCRTKMGYGTRLSTRVPPSLWGAYGQYMYLHPNSVVFPISEDVPAEAAVLAVNALSNGIQWVRVMGKASVGDVVVVQGTGPQGLYAVIAARESGAYRVIVTGLERDAQRLKLAKEFGADFTVNVEKEDAVKLVSELTRGKMADLVVDVTGSPAAFPVSVNLVKKQGTVVCGGTPGRTVTAPLAMEKIALDEIRLQGVYSSTFDSIACAIRLIESRKYPIEKMVTHRFPLEQAEQAVKAVGGETPGLYPIKAVLAPH